MACKNDYECNNSDCGSSGDNSDSSNSVVCVESVTVLPSHVTLTEGEWYYGATAKVYPSNATCKEVHWYSANSSIASVNASNGYIRANSSGRTTIYAEATDGSYCRNSLIVTVSRTVPVTSVSLDRTSMVLEQGDCASLVATVCPENASNNYLNWRSSDTSVAQVSDGVVTAISPGSAVITAAAIDGSEESASCTVHVTGDVLVNCVTVKPATCSLTLGDKGHLLDATVSPSNATCTCVVWSSMNDNIATVIPDSGLVTAQGVGTTTIRATAQDGSNVYGTCRVTVAAPIAVTGITLNKSCITMNKGISFDLDATVMPSNAAVTRVQWSTDNASVATVTSRGKVCAVGIGKAKITATAKDGSGKHAHCYVTVSETKSCPAEEDTGSHTENDQIADPVDAYSGAHVLTNTVMTLFGGQSLSLVLHYNSTRLVSGSLAPGWYHNYEKHLEDDNGDILVYSNPSAYARYTSCDACYTEYTCASPDKNGYVLTVNHSAQYPYVLNCNSAQTEYYDAQGYLAVIENHQDFRTLITHTDTCDTITDEVSGKKLYLDKDANGKIVSIRDDAQRQATLSYTGAHLTAICDVNGNSLTYTYDDLGRVLTGKDSKNVVYFTNTYDDYGRVIRQKDAIAGSAETVFEYNGNERITTNRNGDKSTRIYNNEGLLLRYVDENGNVKTYEYDEHHNVIREADACGNAVVKHYNNFNKPDVITDKNGNKTYFTYDNAGNVVKIRYPAVNGVVPEETFVYNTRNQMTQHTDIRGTLTVYTYDAKRMPATKKVGTKNAIEYSYQNGLLKSQTDALGHTTVYAHNALGQMISKTDADGHITSYEYDTCGNLTKVTDANGKSVVTAYDTNYQKTSVTDANGNTTLYSYNGNMKNDAVTLPDGNVIRYEFDGEDRVVKTVDQENNVTTVTYDAGGRMIAKRLPDSATVQYEYDAVGNVVKEINPKGAVITKTYDKLGNVLSVTDHEGNVTRYQYNAMSKPVRVTNGVAGTTVYEYAPSGELLSETDALGNKKTYTYDVYGNRLSATDAKGNTTVYTYDQNNNLLTVKDAMNHVTTYTYNALNQCVSVKDALNNVIRYGYDALGRRTTVTDAKGNVFTTVYDAGGNVIKTTDAKGNTVSETTYNSLNLPLTVTDAMGKTTTYTYTKLGKVAGVTDALNHHSEYSYDTRGRNTAVLDSSNHTSTASYDLLGNITRLAGPLGGATEYTYDDMGRLITESTVSGGTVSYTYNELNIREKLTNARGQDRKFFYDAKGRITGYICPEDSVSYAYDANGNVLTVTDSHGTITREYDALNRVTSVTDTDGNVIRYEYDAIGNLTKLIYPDNTAVTYAYDENRNLIRVTDWANRVTSYTYDVNNRVIGVIKPDGSVTTTIYDNMQRVTSTVEKTAGGTVITGFEYTYDDLSRIVEEKVLDKNIQFCYTYDNLSRVTKRVTKKLATNATVSVENYTYDAAGNVTDAPDRCFEYDTNNRLISYNGNAVSYDLDGNMLSNGSLSCSYDSANRLISAGGHTYTYNAEDVRIRNLCADADTTYVYDTNVKLSRLLQKTTNGITTKYVYGLGLIGEEKQDCFKTYHFDYRGSTVAITDIYGNITDTFAYDTYGKLVSRTGSSFVIFGYNGRDGVVTDKNGLIYMRARYYSPDMKRFVNADVVAGEISNAVTLNRYAYANGNPVSFVDPFGLDAQRGNTIVYDGNAYDIFIPTYSSSDNLDGWNQVATLTYQFSDTSFDWANFMVDMVMDPDDMDDIATGKNPNFSQTFSGIVAGYSLVKNFMNALGSNIKYSTVNITFTFQEHEGKRRVIITTGNSKQAKFAKEYAGTTQSVLRNCKQMNEKVWMSSNIENFYEEIIGGPDPGKKPFAMYDLRMVVDVKHKNSTDFYYLWLGENGDLITSPIVYENDKAEIGRVLFSYTPLISLPINQSATVSEEFQNIFNSALKENGLIIQ